MAGHFLCKNYLFFKKILITFRPWASTFCASSPSVLTEAPWSGHCCPILPTKRLRTKDFKDLHGVTQLVGSRSRIPPGIMGLGGGGQSLPDGEGRWGQQQEVRTVVSKMWLLDQQQHQHHPRTGSKCDFLSVTPDFLNGHSEGVIIRSSTGDFQAQV